MNAYQPQPAEQRFILQNVLQASKQLAALPAFSDFDEDLLTQVTDEAGKFVGEVIAPLNRDGDEIGARWKDGAVTMPPGFRDAYQAFRQLVAQFPDSAYAEDARLRMNYILNTLAQYEVHVARYYFRRGAYVAAANRAQQAVVDFDGAPATEEALFILVQSYDRLGLDTLRDDAQRVFAMNFPNSVLPNQGLGRGGKSWWHVWN